jgi:hypothetical protein
MRGDQSYSVCVVDSDGDEVLATATIEAVDPRSAWEQATSIAFRACQGSGAFPLKITVVRLPSSPASHSEHLLGQRW